MLKVMEVNPLPEVCRKCDEQYRRYEAADEAEKLRLELEEGFFFDCGCCEHGGERFCLSEEKEY